VEAARAGDRHAFDEIVVCYDSRLRTLAGQLLTDRADADDALQEAYLKAYRALPRFRGECALGTWLYRITYRCCLDHLRRLPGRPTPLDDLGEARPEEGGDPMDLVDSTDMLRDALSRLTPTQRAVLFLVYCEDVSYEDAARILGVPIGTVGSRASSARAALRAVLGELGRDEGSR
jgi:RNA polymerase sigma-70 factor, ECF subfamily